MDHQSRINCWQMDPDFFQDFPELTADMPSTRSSLLRLRMNNVHNLLEYETTDVEEIDDSFLLRSQQDVIGPSQGPLIC